MSRNSFDIEINQIPPSFSFDEVAALPVAIATAVLGMYNQHPSSKSAHFIPPWEEAGLTAYSGKPVLIMGGASSVGQSGTSVLLHLALT